MKPSMSTLILIQGIKVHSVDHQGEERTNTVFTRICGLRSNAHVPCFPVISPGLSGFWRIFLGFGKNFKINFKMKSLDWKKIWPTPNLRRNNSVQINKNLFHARKIIRNKKKKKRVSLTLNFKA